MRKLFILFCIVFIFSCTKDKGTLLVTTEPLINHLTIDSSSNVIVEDINPDTILQPSPNKNYAFDVNSDGTNDFKFIIYDYAWACSFNIIYYRISINAISPGSYIITDIINETTYYSSNAPVTTTNVATYPKIFSYNDTISSNENYKDSVNILHCQDGFTCPPSGSGYMTWGAALPLNNQKYIGLRCGNFLGWVKVSMSYQLKIYECAISKHKFKN